MFSLKQTGCYVGKIKNINIKQMYKNLFRG